ncbi:MAG TPA: hypothetical protein VM840_02895 [Actinomycetota bacterium]|nr:hypothetical protein [Actinomycetota bacterium]
MSLGLMESVASRDVSMGGGASTRGFWTKRKRSATSLMAAIALLAGIAVAYKLFDKTIPNNVVRDASSFGYTLEAQDVAAGESAYRAVTGSGDQVIFRQSLASCPPLDASDPCQVSTYPGDSRRTNVKITNTQDPAKDAGFEVYVAPGTIVVERWVPPTGTATSGTYQVVPTTDADWGRYVGYWKLGVDKQLLYQVPVTNGEYVNSPTANASYGTACAPTDLRGLTSQSACKLGTIRGKGTTGASVGTMSSAHSRDIRHYRFNMSEEDDGSDQSRFKGWRIRFSLVFVARVPAEAESGRYSAVPN